MTGGTTATFHFANLRRLLNAGSLRAKLLLYGILLHAAILVAYFAVITFLVREGMSKNLEVSAQQTSEILNLAIAPYSSERRFDLLQTFFKELLKNSPEGIQYILVRGEDGQQLVSAGDIPRGPLPDPTVHVQQAIDTGIYHYRQGVLIGGNTVGSVQFGLITRSVGAVVQKVTGVALLMGLIGLALAIASLTFFINNFSRRLQALIEAADCAASGRYDEHVREDGNDEVSVLAHNFNRMSSAVQLRERKLVAIFNSVPVPMSLLSRASVDRDFSVDDMNDAAKATFCSPERADHLPTVHPLSMFVHASDRVHFISHVEQTKSSQALEIPVRSGDNRTLQCLVTGGAFSLAGTQYLAMAMVDVTVLRSIEGELRVLNADLEKRVQDRTTELAHRNDDLARSLDRLQKTQQQLVQSEKLSGLGKIVMAVAHEMNTPIGSALTASTTLQMRDIEFKKRLVEGIRKSELHAFLEDNDTGLDLVVKNLERAAELVMRFKMVAVDRSSLKRCVFNLVDVVREVASTVQGGLSAYPPSLEIDIPADMKLNSYPSVIEQVLVSIVENSVKHAFDGLTRDVIRIHAHHRDEGRVVLSLSDNGRGIAKEHLSKVFDPFFTTRLGQGSSGLGLNIVYNLVNGILGGTITASSQLGTGATFMLIIPTFAPEAG